MEHINIPTSSPGQNASTATHLNRSPRQSSDQLTIDVVPTAIAPVTSAQFLQVTGDLSAFASTSASTLNVEITQPPSPTGSNESTISSTHSLGDTPQMIKFVQEGNLKEIQRWIEHAGITPDEIKNTIRDKNGAGPLHWASRKGHLDIVQWLVKNKLVDLNAKDNNNETALHWALKVEGRALQPERTTSREKVAEFLLQQNDLRLDRGDGATHYRLAALESSSKIVNLFKEKDPQRRPTGSTPTLLTRLKNFADKSTRQLQSIQATPDLPPSSEHFPPLLRAAYDGDAETFVRLLKQGANPNMSDAAGRTALHFAAAKGLEGHLAIIRALLGKTSSPTCDPNQPDNMGDTALHWAFFYRQPAVASLLLDVDDINPNGKNIYNVTPLHFAIVAGDKSATQLLLNKGADVTVKTQGVNALVIAANCGHIDCLQTVMTHIGADNLTSNQVDLALLNATIDGQRAVVEFLLPYVNVATVATEAGESALVLAAYKNHHDIVGLLVAGMRPEDREELRGESGARALAIAAAKGHVESVKCLLPYVNPDVQNGDGDTALVMATNRGHYDVMKALLEHGVDLNIPGKEGFIALHWAVRKDDAEAARILLDDYPKSSGTDPNHETVKFPSPLLLAARAGRGAVIPVLIEHARTDCNTHDPATGLTPFATAASNGHDIVVKHMLLASEKINPTIVEKHLSGTPLHSAAGTGQLGVVRLLMNDVRTKQCLNQLDNRRQTPLFYAAYGGHLNVVKFLLQQSGLNRTDPDIYGQTALGWALIRRHKDIVQMLGGNPEQMPSWLESVPTSPSYLYASLRSRPEHEATALSSTDIDKLKRWLGFPIARWVTKNTSSFRSDKQVEGSYRAEAIAWFITALKGKTQLATRKEAIQLLKQVLSKSVDHNGQQSILALETLAQDWSKLDDECKMLALDEIFTPQRLITLRPNDCETLRLFFRNEILPELPRGPLYKRVRNLVIETFRLAEQKAEHREVIRGLQVLTLTGKHPVTGTDLTDLHESLEAIEAVQRPDVADKLRPRLELAVHDNKIFANGLKWRFRLPMDLDLLGDMKEIDFSGNLIEELPEDIGKWKINGKLDLSDNRIEFLPEGIAKLKDLKELDLSNNRLKSLPDDFKDWPPGLKVNLKGNPNLPPDVVSKLIEYEIAGKSIQIDAKPTASSTLALISPERADAHITYGKLHQSLKKAIDNGWCYAFLRSLPETEQRYLFENSKPLLKWLGFTDTDKALFSSMRAKLKVTNITVPKLPAEESAPAQALALFVTATSDASLQRKGLTLLEYALDRSAPEQAYDALRMLTQRWSTLTGSDNQERALNLMTEARLKTLPTGGAMLLREILAEVVLPTVPKGKLEQKTHDAIFLASLWGDLNRPGVFASSALAKANKQQVAERVLEVRRNPAKTSLSLDQCGLSIPPRVIGSIAWITDLNLSGNLLTALPGEITHLSNLKTLHLADMWHRNVPPGVMDRLAQLPSLTELNLSGNLLNEVPEGLESLQNLRHLRLENTGLSMTETDVERLAGLKNLTYLLAGHNRIARLPGDFSNNLPGLRVLWLNDNPALCDMDNAGLHLFDPPLEQLNLERTKVTSRPEGPKKVLIGNPSTIATLPETKSGRLRPGFSQLGGSLANSSASSVSSGNTVNTYLSALSVTGTTESEVKALLQRPGGLGDCSADELETLYRYVKRLPLAAQLNLLSKHDVMVRTAIGLGGKVDFENDPKKAAVLSKVLAWYALRTPGDKRQWDALTMLDRVLKKAIPAPADNAKPPALSGAIVETLRMVAQGLRDFKDPKVQERAAALLTSDRLVRVASPYVRGYLLDLLRNARPSIASKGARLEIEVTLFELDLNAQVDRTKAAAAIRSCLRDKKVEELDLKELELKDGDLPEEAIGELTGLRSLNLYNNHLTRPPQFLRKLAGLKRIDLGKNHFTDIDAVLSLIEKHRRRHLQLKEVKLTTLLLMPHEIARARQIAAQGGIDVTLDGEYGKESVLHRLVVSKYFGQEELLPKLLRDARASGNKTPRPLSVVFLDIDKFGPLNKKFGEYAGDEALKGVCDAATEAINKLPGMKHALVRWGGEEFVALMPDTSNEEAQQNAENLRQIVRNQVIEYVERHKKKRLPQLTISIGVKTYEPKKDDTDDAGASVVIDANRAMRIAKERGRDRVVNANTYVAIDEADQKWTDLFADDTETPPLFLLKHDPLYEQEGQALAWLGEPNLLSQKVASDAVDELLAAAKRSAGSSTSAPLSAAIVSLRDPAAWNQRGEAASQQALQRLCRTVVGEAIEKQPHAQYLVARWGENAFAVLMPDTNEEKAKKLKQALENAIQQQKIDGLGGPKNLAASIGIHTYQPKSGDGTEAGRNILQLAAGMQPKPDLKEKFVAKTPASTTASVAATSAINPAAPPATKYVPQTKVIRLPNQKPVPGYGIQVGTDDGTNQVDMLSAFRPPHDPWGYHEVRQPGQGGLYALNMINGGRWLITIREFDSANQSMEDVAAFQNTHHPERGLLEGRRGILDALDLRNDLQGVKRTSVEYVEKGSGEVKSVFIVERKNSFWAYHGTDPALELLEEATDMGSAIEAFYKEHGQPGEPIEYLYPKKAEVKGT